MGGHDDGPPQALVQLFDEAQDTAASFGVQVSGGFICQNQSRVVYESPGNSRALHLTARNLRRLVVGALLQFG
jgi:hypothetical protein